MKKECNKVDREILRKLVKHGYDLRRDRHWLKTTELEHLESLIDEPSNGFLQKIKSKVKGNTEHKQEEPTKDKSQHK